MAKHHQRENQTIRAAGIDSIRAALHQLGGDANFQAGNADQAVRATLGARESVFEKGCDLLTLAYLCEGKAPILDDDPALTQAAIAILTARMPDQVEILRHELAKPTEDRAPLERHGAKQAPELAPVGLKAALQAILPNELETSIREEASNAARAAIESVRSELANKPRDDNSAEPALAPRRPLTLDQWGQKNENWSAGSCSRPYEYFRCNFDGKISGTELPFSTVGVLSARVTLDGGLTTIPVEDYLSALMKRTPDIASLRDKLFQTTALPGFNSIPAGATQIAFSVTADSTRRLPLPFGYQIIGIRFRDQNGGEISGGSVVQSCLGGAHVEVPPSVCAIQYLIRPASEQEASRNLELIKELWTVLPRPPAPLTRESLTRDAIINRLFRTPESKIEEALKALSRDSIPLGYSTLPVVAKLHELYSKDSAGFIRGYRVGSCLHFSLLAIDCARRFGETGIVLGGLNVSGDQFQIDIGHAVALIPKMKGWGPFAPTDLTSLARWPRYEWEPKTPMRGVNIDAGAERAGRELRDYCEPDFISHDWEHEHPITRQSVTLYIENALAFQAALESEMPYPQLNRFLREAIFTSGGNAEVSCQEFYKLRDIPLGDAVIERLLLETPSVANVAAVAKLIVDAAKTVTEQKEEISGRNFPFSLKALTTLCALPEFSKIEETLSAPALRVLLALRGTSFEQNNASFSTIIAQNSGSLLKATSSDDALASELATGLVNCLARGQLDSGEERAIIECLKALAEQAPEKIGGGIAQIVFESTTLSEGVASEFRKLLGHSKVKSGFITKLSAQLRDDLPTGQTLETLLPEAFSLEPAATEMTLQLCQHYHRRVRKSAVAFGPEIEGNPAHMLALAHMGRTGAELLSTLRILCKHGGIDAEALKRTWPSLADSDVAATIVAKLEKSESDSLYHNFLDSAGVAISISGLGASGVEWNTTALEELFGPQHPLSDLSRHVAAEIRPWSITNIDSQIWQDFASAYPGEWQKYLNFVRDSAPGNELETRVATALILTQKSYKQLLVAGRESGSAPGTKNGEVTRAFARVTQHYQQSLPLAKATSIPERLLGPLIADSREPRSRYAAPGIFKPQATDSTINAKRWMLHTQNCMRGQTESARAQLAAIPNGVDFRSHRSYSPGDDVRHIDWNKFASLDELVFKETENHKFSNPVILLDALWLAHGLRAFIEPAKSAHTTADLFGNFLRSVSRATGRGAHAIKVYVVNSTDGVITSFVARSAKEIPTRLIPVVAALEAVADAERNASLHREIDFKNLDLVATNGIRLLPNEELFVASLPAWQSATMRIHNPKLRFAIPSFSNRG